jgi:hypothetical protein
MLRGLKVKIPFRGEWRKVANVHRGEPVIFTGREWQSRDPEWEDEGPLWKWVYFPLFTLLIAWLFLGRDGTLFWIVWAIIYVSMWNTFYPVSLRHHRSRECSRRGYSGLFENGVQWRLLMYSDTYFLPYSEIVDFHLVEQKESKVLEFHIRGFEKPWSSHDLWRTLGPEGLEELRARVDAAQCRVHPPQLVVYSERPPVGTSGIPVRDGAHRSPTVSAVLRF